VLRPGLRLLHQAQEVALALSETFSDCLHGVLRKLLILNDEIVQIVSKIVSAGGAAVAVEYSEEANLRPLDIEVLLVLWLQDIQNDRHAVLVVVSDDSLVRVRRIGLDDATLLGTCLRWLVILQLNCLRVQRSRVLTKEQRLHLHELYVRVLRLLARERRRYLEVTAVGVRLGVAGRAVRCYGQIVVVRRAN